MAFPGPGAKASTLPHIHQTSGKEPAQSMLFFADDFGVIAVDPEEDIEPVNVRSSMWDLPASLASFQTPTSGESTGELTGGTIYDSKAKSPDVDIKLPKQCTRLDKKATK